MNRSEAAIALNSLPQKPNTVSNTAENAKGQGLAYTTQPLQSAGSASDKKSQLSATAPIGSAKRLSPDQQREQAAKRRALKRAQRDRARAMPSKPKRSRPKLVATFGDLVLIEGAASVADFVEGLSDSEARQLLNETMGRAV